VRGGAFGPATSLEDLQVGKERAPDDLAWRMYIMTMAGIAAFCTVVFVFIL